MRSIILLQTMHLINKALHALVALRTATAIWIDFPADLSSQINGDDSHMDLRCPQNHSEVIREACRKLSGSGANSGTSSSTRTSARMVSTVCPRLKLVQAEHLAGSASSGEQTRADIASTN